MPRSRRGISRDVGAVGWRVTDGGTIWACISRKLLRICSQGVLFENI